MLAPPKSCLDLLTWLLCLQKEGTKQKQKSIGKKNLI